MKTKMLILTLVLALMLAVAGAALATDGFERPREVLAGGASKSAADGITLRATLGQAVVGVIANGGGDVVLGQGFWHRLSLAAGPYNTYLPLVIK